jgi:hypothetical protein
MTQASDPEHSERPSRAEVAEYVHDLAGQLATLAQRAGLVAAAEALRCAQTEIEKEF